MITPAQDTDTTPAPVKIIRVTTTFDEYLAVMPGEDASEVALMGITKPSGDVPFDWDYVEVEEGAVPGDRLIHYP